MAEVYFKDDILMMSFKEGLKSKFGDLELAIILEYFVYLILT